MEPATWGLIFVGVWLIVVFLYCVFKACGGNLVDIISCDCFRGPCCECFLIRYSISLQYIPLLNAPSVRVPCTGDCWGAGGRVDRFDREYPFDVDLHDPYGPYARPPSYGPYGPYGPYQPYQPSQLPPIVVVNSMKDRRERRRRERRQERRKTKRSERSDSSSSSDTSSNSDESDREAGPDRFDPERRERAGGALLLRGAGSLGDGDGRASRGTMVV